MTCADIFKAFGDQIIDSLDPLVIALLLLVISFSFEWLFFFFYKTNLSFYSCSNMVKRFCFQLVQLLLKSSQDKRFVCEVAEKALITLTIWVSPILLLPKLQPYFKNRNPRIRAKASMCFSRSVPRLVSIRSHLLNFNIMF